MRQRLERLRAATGKTWDAIAADLGLKRAMVFHVLSGRRNFSSKTIERLQKLEVASGVRSEASVLVERGLNAQELVEALLSSGADAHSSVTATDIDDGEKTIGLEYKRGEAPDDYPTEIKVCAPRNATICRIIGKRGCHDDPSRLLAACLPDLTDKPDLLERLTPGCYTRLLHTALDLTFGLGWRNRLQPGERKRETAT